MNKDCMAAYTEGFNDGYQEFNRKLLSAIPFHYRHIAECDGKLCPSSVVLRKVMQIFGIEELTIEQLYALHSSPQPASKMGTLNVTYDSLKVEPPTTLEEK